MTRSRISLLLILDLAFLGGAGSMLWKRYNDLTAAMAPAKNSEPVPPPVAVEPTPAPMEIALSTATVAVSTETTPAEAPAPAAAAALPPTPSTAPGEPTPAPAPPVARVRRTFKYTNFTARKVSLTGEFNNWTPQPFRKTSAGLWTLTVEVPPGDHAYQLIIDGRPIRDPNQPRTDDKGRSLLNVPPTARR